MIPSPAVRRGGERRAWCKMSIAQMLILAFVPYLVFMGYMNKHVSDVVMGRNTSTDHLTWEVPILQYMFHGDSDKSGMSSEEWEPTLEETLLEESEESFLPPLPLDGYSNSEPLPIVIKKGETIQIEFPEPLKELQTSKIDQLLSKNNSLAEIEQFVYETLQYWNYSTPIAKPKDLQFPYHVRPENGFVSFEPDSGGFNNIRMGFEMVLIVALVLGRTLVLPPRQQYYRLHKTSSISDYFDIDALGQVIPVISTEDYLKLKGVNISYPTTGYVQYPQFQELREWIRSTSFCPEWDMIKNVLVIPDKKTCEQYSPNEHQNESNPFYSLNEFTGKRRLVELNKTLLESENIHFQVDKPKGPHRLFGNWQSFAYFTPPEWFFYVSGFLRDHLHYNEEIVRKSASLIAQIISQHGRYQAIHIRRGEFQYTQTRIDMHRLLENIYPLLDASKTIYIATDEKDFSIFKPLTEKFNVVFFRDYLKSLVKTERKLHGMIEQYICSFADLFIGTELSTFSSYITRMRSYIREDVAINKNVYVTTFKYKGDPEYDNRFTNSTWMESSVPKWPHASWSREYAFAWAK